ncbi:hypothetical protein [Phocoenobacter uteri]|nr:hypothetical protein [Phocoenobacter uteri]
MFLKLFDNKKLMAVVKEIKDTNEFFILSFRGIGQAEWDKFLEKLAIIR